MVNNDMDNGVDYDIGGNVLIYQDGEYSNIPERCPECHCAQDKPEWKEFSNTTIHVCGQCHHEMYINEMIRPTKLYNVRYTVVMEIEAGNESEATGIAYDKLQEAGFHSFAHEETWEDSEDD